MVTDESGQAWARSATLPDGARRLRFLPQAGRQYFLTFTATSAAPPTSFEVRRFLPAAALPSPVDVALSVSDAPTRCRRRARSPIRCASGTRGSPRPRGNAPDERSRDTTLASAEGTTVTNHGPEAAERVFVTQLLPEEVELVSAGSDRGGCRADGRGVVCAAPALGVNETAVVTVSARVSKQATKGSTLWSAAGAVAETPDPDYASNLARQGTLVAR